MKVLSPRCAEKELLFKNLYSKNETAHKIFNKNNSNKNNDSIYGNYEENEIFNEKNGNKLTSSEKEVEGKKMNISENGNLFLSLKEQFLKSKQARKEEKQKNTISHRNSSEKLLDMLITKKKLERLRKENSGEEIRKRSRLGEKKVVEGGSDEGETRQHDVEEKENSKRYETFSRKYLTPFKSEQILTAPNHMASRKNMQTQFKKPSPLLQTASATHIIFFPNYIKSKVEMAKEALEVLQEKLLTARKIDSDWNQGSLSDEDSLKQRPENINIPFRPLTPHLPTISSFNVCEFCESEEKICDEPGSFKSSSYFSLVSSSTVPTISSSSSSHHIPEAFPQKKIETQTPKAKARTKLSNATKKIPKTPTKRHKSNKKKTFFKQNDSFETVEMYSEAQKVPFKSIENTLQNTPSVDPQNSSSKLMQENVIEFSSLLDDHIAKQVSEKTVDPSFSLNHHYSKPAANNEQGDISEKNMHLEQSKFRNFENQNENIQVVAKKRRQFVNILPNNIEDFSKDHFPLSSPFHETFFQDHLLPPETLSELESIPPKPFQRLFNKNVDKLTDNFNMNFTQKNEEIIENTEETVHIPSEQACCSYASLLPETPENRGSCNNNDNVYIVSEKFGAKSCVPGYCDPPPYTGTLPRGCIPPCTVASCAVNPCGIFFDTVPLDPYQRCLDRLNNLRCMIRNDCGRCMRSCCGFEGGFNKRSISSLFTTNTKCTEVTSGSTKNKTSKSDTTDKSKSESTKTKKSKSDTSKSKRPKSTSDSKKGEDSDRVKKKVVQKDSKPEKKKPSKASKKTVKSPDSSLKHSNLGKTSKKTDGKASAKKSLKPDDRMASKKSIKSDKPNSKSVMKDQRMVQKNVPKSQAQGSKSDMKKAVSKFEGPKDKSHDTVKKKSVTTKKSINSVKKSQDSIKSKHKNPSNVNSVHFAHDEHFYERLMQMFQKLTESKNIKDAKPSVEKEISIEKIEKALQNLEKKKNLKIFFPTESKKTEGLQTEGEVYHVRLDAQDLSKQPTQFEPKIQHELPFKNLPKFIDDNLNYPDTTQELKNFSPHIHLPQKHATNPMEMYNKHQTSLWKQFLCTEFCKPYKKGFFYRQAENLPPSDCNSSKTSIREKFKIRRRKRSKKKHSSSDESKSSVGNPQINFKNSKNINKKLKKLTKLMADNESLSEVSSDESSKEKDSLIDESKIKNKFFNKKKVYSSISSEQKVQKTSKKKKKQLSSNKTTTKSSVSSNQTSACLNKALNVQKHCKQEIKKTEMILRKIMDKKGLKLGNDESNMNGQVEKVEEAKMDKVDKVEKKNSNKNICEKNSLDNAQQKQCEAQDEKILSTSFFQLLKDFIKTKLTSDTDNSNSYKTLINNSHLKQFSNKQPLQNTQQLKNEQNIPSQINNHQQSSQLYHIQMQNNQPCPSTFFEPINTNQTFHNQVQHPSDTPKHSVDNASGLKQFHNSIASKINTYLSRKPHQHSQPLPIQPHSTQPNETMTTLTSFNNSVPSSNLHKDQSQNISQPVPKSRAFDFQSSHLPTNQRPPNYVEERKLDKAKSHQKQPIESNLFFRPSAPSRIIPKCFQQKIRPNYNTYNNFSPKSHGNFGPHSKRPIKISTKKLRFMCPQRRDRFEKAVEACTQTEKTLKASRKLFKDKTSMTNEHSKKIEMKKKFLKEKNSVNGKEKVKMDKKSSEILITIKNSTSQQNRAEQDLIQKILESLQYTNMRNPKKKVSLTSLYEQKKHLVQKMMSIDWNLNKLKAPHVTYSQPTRSFLSHQQCTSAFDDFSQDLLPNPPKRQNYSSRRDKKCLLDLIGNANLYLLDDLSKTSSSANRYVKRPSVVSSVSPAKRLPRTLNAVRAPFLALKRASDKVLRPISRKKNQAIL